MILIPNIPLQCLPEEKVEKKQLYAYKLGSAGMTDGGYYTHSLCNLAQLFPPVDRSLPDRERGDSCREEKEKVKEAEEGMLSSANVWHKVPGVHHTFILGASIPQLAADKNDTHTL